MIYSYHHETADELPNKKYMTHISRPVPAGYTPLIEQMRFYIEPEISCSRFFGTACFTEESINNYRTSNNIKDLQLTELGAFVTKHIEEGLFIDVPCGLAEPLDPTLDFAITPLAKRLGAKEIWRVDNDKNVLGSKTFTAHDDILSFMSKIDVAIHPLAIYISALQPDAEFCALEENQKTIAVPYLNALYDELARVCEKGDLVILNSSDMLCAGIDEIMFPYIHPSLALPPRGFSLMRRCERNKVNVLVKD